MRPPWDSRVSWPLRVPKTELLDCRPAEALVGDDHPVVTRWWSCSSSAWATSRSPSGPCQPPDDRHALRGAEQVEPEAPEPAGVGWAVAVGGVFGQGAALDRLAGRGAGQRGGVEQASEFVPGRGVPGQFGGHGREQPAAGSGPFAVAGLAGQVLQTCPGNGCGRSGSIGGPWRCPAGAGPRPGRSVPHRTAPACSPGRASGPAQGGQDTVLKMDIQCEQEGVEIGLHTSGLTPSVPMQQSPRHQHR